jgi:hypothetical protein
MSGPVAWMKGIRYNLVWWFLYNEVHVGKIMESSVYKYVHNYLLAHCIITPHQSGFTRGDSVINQLFIYVFYLISNVLSTIIKEPVFLSILFFKLFNMPNSVESFANIAKYHPYFFPLI